MEPSQTLPALDGVSPASAPAADPQSQAHLRQLVAQNSHLQAQVAALLAESQIHSAQVDALTRHFTGSQAEAAQHAMQTDLISRLETVQEQLDELAKTVTKLGRTQFKSNTLTESREQQVGQSLATLQEIATRREEIAADRQLAEQQRLAHLRQEARGDLAADLLPSLDGLELALAHGRQMVAEQQRRAEAARSDRQQPPPPPPPGVWDRVRRVFTEPTPPMAPPSPPPVDAGLAESLNGWLEGLALVQARFADLLAAESIQPIDALHKPFDPRLHVAVGVPGSPRSARRHTRQHTCQHSCLRPAQRLCPGRPGAALCRGDRLASPGRKGCSVKPTGYWDSTEVNPIRFRYDRNSVYHLR